MTLCYVAQIHEATRQALLRRSPPPSDELTIHWPARLAKVPDEFDPFDSYLFFTAADPTFAAQRLGVELLTDCPASDTLGPMRSPSPRQAHRLARPALIPLADLLACCAGAHQSEEAWRQSLIGRAVTVPMRKSRTAPKRREETDDLDPRDLDRLTRVSGVVIEVKGTRAEVLVRFLGREASWTVPLSQIEEAA